MGPKIKIFNKGDKALILSPFTLSRKNKHFQKKESQNRMKNGRVMPIRRSCAKVAVGFFGINGGHSGHFFMTSTSNLFCPSYT